MAISICVVHSASFRLLRHPTKTKKRKKFLKNTSKSARENSHLFYDFADFSTFFKFQSSTTHSEYNSLWVTVELNISGTAGESSYLLFYYDFNVSSILQISARYHSERIFSIISN